MTTHNKSTHFASSHFRGGDAGSVLATATLVAQATAAADSFADRRVAASIDANATVTNSLATQTHAVSAAAFAQATATARVIDARVAVLQGGGYRGMWTPVREVSVDAVKIVATSSVRWERPTARQTPQVGAITAPTRSVGRCKVTVEVPTTGAMPPMVRASGSERVRFKKPKSGARSPFVRATTSSKCNCLPPVPEVVVMPVSVRRNTYYGYYTPHTVQNPTEEMLYFL